MPRQYTQRTPEEKYGIVQDYFSSGLPLTKYARTHNIPRTTISQWVEKYNSSFLAETPSVINNNDFINVTKESIEIAKTKEIISSKNIIKLEMNNTFKLEFDISVLDKVLEIIKWLI